MDRLPDRMEQNARVEVRNDGTPVGTRRIIDFVGATSITDDGVNDIVTVTIPTDGTPSGAAGGDLTGTYPNPEIADTGVAPDQYGDASHTPVLVIGSDGRIVAASEVPTSASGSSPWEIGDADEAGDTVQLSADYSTNYVGLIVNADDFADWLVAVGQPHDSFDVGTALGYIELYGDGTVDEARLNAHATDATITADDAATLSGTTSVLVSADSGTATVSGLTVNLAGDDISFSISSGYLTITGLPIVNPGGTGRVWNNGGVLSIT